MASIRLWPVLHKLKPDFVSNIKFFYVFGNEGNNVIIVTKNDKVFAFGDNNDGCLGLGHNNAVREPQIVNELCDQQIIDISYGLHYVFALTKSGTCFSWGELGFGTQTCEKRPKLIKGLLNENVVQIICGLRHSLVLTKSGELYGFGYNYFGQIGCGNNSNQLTPIKIIGFNSEKIVSIACGGYHSLVLTDEGQVYSWGYNSHGQLGLGNKAHQNRPQKINLNNNQIVKSISCGWNHSLLLTIDGNIYAFGDNKFGQLGNGNTTEQLNPVKINGSQKFKEIAAISWPNISVSKGVDDYCYVWGQCENESFLTPNKTKIKSIDEIFALFSTTKISPKPIYLYLTTNEFKARNAILKIMLKIFNNPKYSDIKFEIENKLIYVQKCIIESNSKYFESKFTERAIRESTDNVIVITEYSYDVYYAFLKYLYTDCIDIEIEKAMDLLVLGNDYKEEELKLKCVDIIKNDITIENVCTFYCASIKHNLSELEDFCFNFAVNKMNQIVRTEGFRQMDENSMKKFTERVAKNYKFR
jgi:RCC1 and BTB domain-containing protein